jgi:prophage regulatory protein
MAEQAPIEETETGEPKRSSEFMLRSEVMQESTLSKTVIWRLMNRGEFPQPVRLSPNRVAWVRREVEEWKEAKKRERVAA